MPRAHLTAKRLSTASPLNVLEPELITWACQQKQSSLDALYYLRRPATSRASGRHRTGCASSGILISNHGNELANQADADQQTFSLPPLCCTETLQSAVALAVEQQRYIRERLC